MSLQGRVQNGVVVLEGGARLPDGVLVEVMPLSSQRSGAEVVPVSKEQQEALLGLIGVWKTALPPSDEDVERMIDEHRMKKSG